MNGADTDIDDFYAKNYKKVLTFVFECDIIVISYANVLI